MPKKKKAERADQPMSFAVPKDLRDALHDEANQRGMSISGLIRHILTQWFHFQGFSKRDLKPTKRVLEERQR